MKLRSRAGVVAMYAVVLSALVLTGCASDHGKSTGGSQSPPNVDAAKVVQQAADAMRKVTGMHVSVRVQGQVPNLAVTKLDGDISNKPQTVAKGTATLSVGKKNVDSSFVYVDGHLYSDVADPGKKYTDYGDGMSIYDVSTILDPNKGLANLLSKLQNPKAVGSEQVDNIATTKINGESSSSDIARLAGSRLGPQNEKQTPTTVWIASDGSHHLVKLQINPVQNGSVTLTMSKWGETVTATKPV
ncbi:LppX_LprAFG lipoprotein [Mycobacterium fragae]|uniref:Lipoprotein LprA n=1 Tax=Mycobacterium fragae TaxID=1260918 RepID=A0A1X1V6W0_9MYCO|nr:LppX_LprAFG lipoprotein [Mycobacterium fragae]MCV7399379.1 LppX_LprAFG lipoprotein [Mycobacterium fragae]ORV64759.1 hypothetical protein AWC06_06375 [Mycobacterium fragae]